MIIRFFNTQKGGGSMKPSLYANNQTLGREINYVNKEYLEDHEMALVDRKILKLYNHT